MEKHETQTGIELAKTLPVCTKVDVAVVGAGPAGIMAALAAAEDGLKVALIESRSFVGGNLTIGLPILGFLSQKGKPIIAGLPQKLIDQLKARNAAGPHQACPLHVSLTLIEPEVVKSVALEMLGERGVDLMLHTTFCGVVMDGNRIGALIVESKSGREAILADLIIDGTGDADVAFRSGVPCEKGSEQGKMQPPTLMFCMDGVDTERLRMSLANEPENYDVDFIPADYFGQNRRFILVGLRKLIAKARAEGYVIPNERTIIICGLREGEVWINMTRVKGIDGTEMRSLTAGEIETRGQIDDLYRYLVSYVPGFEKAFLSKVAPFLGIRETRRIVGQYTMTGDDIRQCCHFDDAIAVGSYPIDLHSPDGNDCKLEWCGDCYDIPYGSLVPKQVENLLVAGRSISTTHEAMAAIRVMSTCMAMGEAAGRAAKMCIREKVSPVDLDVRKLQKELLSRGAYLRSQSE